MAITDRYLDVELATGLNDGTSEANAWQSWSAAVTGLTAGQRLNVKNPSARSDQSSTTFTFSITTAATSPIHIRGYGSTIGDGTSAQFENMTLSITGTGHNNVLVENLDILNTTLGQACFQATSTGPVFFNCKAVNNGGSTSDVIRCFYCSAGGSVVNCYAEANGTTYTVGGAAGLIHITNGVAYGNVVVFGSSFINTAQDIAGIYATAPVEHNVAVVRNVVINKSAYPVAYGINFNGFSSSITDGGFCCNNTVHGFRVGILMDEGGSGMDGTSLIANNLITGCQTSLAQDGVFSMVPAFNCAFDGNIGQHIICINCKRITADPYTNLSTYDLTLNSEVGGGLVCRARAADATGGTLDIGALGA